MSVIEIETILVAIETVGVLAILYIEIKMYRREKKHD